MPKNMYICWTKITGKGQPTSEIYSDQQNFGKGAGEGIHNLVVCQSFQKGFRSLAKPIAFDVNPIETLNLLFSTQSTTL